MIDGFFSIGYELVQIKLLNAGFGVVSISLMIYVTTILLKIIQRRLTEKRDQEGSHPQNGFGSGVGTMEGIFNLRTICERALEV